MPGIFGFCGIIANPIEHINQMQAAMCVYPHFIEDNLHVVDNLAASRVHLGKIGEECSPYIDEMGRCAWIEGEVYNLPEVLDRLGWDKHDKTCLALPALLLHAYETGQLDVSLKYLDGYFCAAIYDPEQKKVLNISDRYGMRMLYWYHQNGLFAWASEVKGLLAIDSVDRTIDPTSLSCFMDLGYLMGEHTWFQHIRLIKPATILEYDIDSNKLSQRYYWTWGEIKPSELSFDEAVDELYEIFMESVRRRFDPNERIGISLSGGLDSRAILAAVNKLYPDYEGYAYTFGIPNCDDIRIAKQVAERSSWRHQEFYLCSQSWFHPRKEMIWNTDGMLDMMHMHGGEFRERVAENIDINLNGYAGDVVIGGGWIGTYPKNQRSNNISLAKAYKTYAQLAELDEAYFDLDDVEPGLYASRVRRFTNMGTVNLLAMIEQRKPFFDNSVINWAYSVPSCYREGNMVYAKMLQRYFPRYFKDIPWQKTGKPAGIVNSAKNNIPNRVVNRLIRLAKSYAGIQDSKGYTNYAQWIRERQIADELTQLLSPSNGQYSQLTAVDWLQTYLMPHFSSRDTNKSHQILRAATVELYMRRVFKHL